MATCPKCQTEDCTKDGVVKGKQQYKCKSCGYRHTVSHRGISHAFNAQVEWRIRNYTNLTIPFFDRRRINAPCRREVTDSD